MDLMEKPIQARTAKLQAMNKIMDKPWKTLIEFTKPYPQPSVSISKPE